MNSATYAVLSILNAVAMEMKTILIKTVKIGDDKIKVKTKL